MLAAREGHTMNHRFYWVMAAFLAGFVAAAPALAASDAAGVPMAVDDSTYGKLVTRAAAEDAKLDFRALRIAYLTSPRRIELLTLSHMRVDMGNLPGEQYARARDAAAKILADDYTDILSWGVLAHSCEQLNDAPCLAHAKFVLGGLLDSIIGSGNGQSCSSGWEMVSISEQIDVLHTLGGEYGESQDKVEGGHICSVVQQQDENGKGVLRYFNMDIAMRDIAKVADKMDQNKKP